MLVPLSEAAKAVSVSEGLLRELIKQKRITFYRLSERTTRFDLDELRQEMRTIAQAEPFQQPSHGPAQ